VAVVYPTVQDVQDAEFPEAALKVPMGHASQAPNVSAVAPAFANLPAGHVIVSVVQASVSVICPACVPYLPAGQGVHDD
jgi:hypothetical protein